MKKFFFLVFLFIFSATFTATREEKANRLQYAQPPTYLALSPEPAEVDNIDPMTKQAAAIALRYLEVLQEDNAIYAATIKQAVQRLSKEAQLNIMYSVTRAILTKEETKEKFTDENSNQGYSYEVRKLTQDELQSTCALSLLTRESVKVNLDPEKTHLIRPEREAAMQPQETAPAAKKTKRCTIL